MKNIVIYTQSGSSQLESGLGQLEDCLVKIADPAEIKKIETSEVDLAVLDNTHEVNRDILIRNKIAVPLLIAAENVYTDVTVRAEAYDYILLPQKPGELAVRAANLLKIKQLKDEFNVVTTTDELTGLYNRTYLHNRLEEELSRSKRYNIPLSCLLFDIDYFKVVNDIYGYDWGDVLLKDIAETIKRFSARKEDILTRYGDEEFIIVLPNTSEESAYIFAERFRKDIEKMEFKPAGEEERHPITISGGISSYPFLTNANETAQTLIRYAEHALYNAKKRGKNKIVQFSQINLEL